MAKTGINIQVSNTTFAGVPKVNENTLMIFFPFTLSHDDRVYDSVVRKVYSSSELVAGSPAHVKKEVDGYFAPTTTISNNGKPLWVCLVSSTDMAQYDPNDGSWTMRTEDEISTLIADFVASTVVDGFENRPRQIVLVAPPSYYVDTEVGGGLIAPDFVRALQNAITNLYAEGFATVGIINASGDNALSVEYDLGDYGTRNAIISVPDLKEKYAPFVSVVCVTDEAASEIASVGKVAGYLTSKSVGSSIGDANVEAFANKMYLLATYGGSDITRFDCATLSKELIEELGDNQWLFTRTRPPRNGLWWNDGATCADPATALSTLEAGRTIASITDDLREFFTYYINTRVPVADNGDIDPTYKQVVIDAAMSKVIQPYISSGDISNARIELKAVNNNMVESRTWEVKLSILPAPTLRWVDAYVFYVKTLE